MEQLRVLLAEDNDDLCTALAGLLNAHPDIACVGSTGCLDEVASHAGATSAQVIVLDMDLQGQSSLRRLPELRAQLSGVAFVVFSGHDHPEMMRAAQEAGAASYILKSSDPTTLVAAIRAAAASPLATQ
jgi:two-component system response regulator DesR